MLGSFSANGLTFTADDGYTEVEIDGGAELHEEELDRAILATARVPDLNGAPLASWILARIAHLVGARLGSTAVEVCEGGVFVLDFVLSDATGERIGKVQVQAGWIGAGVLGVVAASVRPELVVRALVSVLAAEPESVGLCEIRVVDSAEENDPGSRTHRYGFDGRRYLADG
jgi:hypothetical protein